MCTANKSSKPLIIHKRMLGRVVTSNMSYVRNRKDVKYNCNFLDINKQFVHCPFFAHWGGTQETKQLFKRKFGMQKKPV